MKSVIVYMTARNQAEARKIARALLSARLAACVNILGPIRSLYRWKGRLADDREVALIAKTRADNTDALIRKVRSVHSYEVPCVVTVPILSGNPPFLKWIGQETARRRR